MTASTQQTAGGRTDARLVGITGGFGAGKSTVSRIIAERYPVLDSDAIARDLMEGDEAVRAALRARFGDEVFTGDGTLRRAMLAERVFRDASLLAALNAIVHPPTVERIHNEAAAKAAEGHGIGFVESALLFEAELDEQFDYIIAVVAAPDTVLQRAAAAGRFSETDARARLSRQMDPDEKAALADFAIHNDGDAALLRDRVLFILRLVEALCRRPR
jgi:dephospho-CoA kinase